MSMAAALAEMAAMEQQMMVMQVAAEQFQSEEETLNMENSALNAAAQFSNSLGDSLKSAAK